MRYLPLCVLLMGCGSSFPMPRSAAHHIPVSTPNKAAAHEESLDGCIDRSLARQEKMDRVDDLMQLKR